MQPGTIAYAAGWGAIIPDDQLGPLAFLIPKEQKRPKVLQVVDVSRSRAFSWLTAATSAFTLKTLLRHYAKWALSHGK